jgi:hypothetical protein
VHVKKSKKREKPAQEVEENEVETPSLLPLKKKKKKSSTLDDESNILINQPQEQVVDKLESLNLPAQNGTAKKKEITAKAPSEDESEQQKEETTKAPGEVEKKKRKRRRRKSQHKVPSEAVDTSLEMEMSSAQAPLYPIVPIYSSNKKKTHIYFGDEDTESQAVISPVQANGSNTNLVKAKMNGNGITSKNHSNPVVVAAVPPQLGALLSLRSAVFSKKEQATRSPVKPVYNNVPPPSSTPPCKQTHADESNNESAATKVDITKYPIFTGPPRVGDVVAFKVNSIFNPLIEISELFLFFVCQVLELSENYNPEVSDYYQGRITQVAPNGDITADLIGRVDFLKSHVL